MSRFFKSAAFPILIVVVLAFFAQKLIGSSSHSQKQTFGNMLYQLEHSQVQSMSLHEKDNTRERHADRRPEVHGRVPGRLRLADHHRREVAASR